MLTASQDRHQGQDVTSTQDLFVSGVLAIDLNNADKPFAKLQLSNDFLDHASFRHVEFFFIEMIDSQRS